MKVDLPKSCDLLKICDMPKVMRYYKSFFETTSAFSPSYQGFQRCCFLLGDRPAGYEHVEQR